MSPVAKSTGSADGRFLCVRAQFLREARAPRASDDRFFECRTFPRWPLSEVGDYIAKPLALSFEGSGA